MIEPRIVLVDDYHEFDHIARYTSLITGSRVKCIELGCVGSYVGLVYQGKKPSNKVIKELLKANKIELNRGD